MNFEDLSFKMFQDYRNRTNTEYLIVGLASEVTQTGFPLALMSYCY